MQKNLTLERNLNGQGAMQTQKITKIVYYQPPDLLNGVIYLKYWNNHYSDIYVSKIKLIQNIYMFQYGSYAMDDQMHFIQCGYFPEDITPQKLRYRMFLDLVK